MTPDLSGLAVVGVGIDVVAVQRFSESLARTPGLRSRLFAPDELLTAGGAARHPQSLAGRFAAKEAVAKALGVPAGLDWHDCRVMSEESGRPVLELRATVAQAASALGVTGWRLSLSHDGGIAAAVVIALGKFGSGETGSAEIGSANIGSGEIGSGGVAR